MPRSRVASKQTSPPSFRTRRFIHHGEYQFYHQPIRETRTRQTPHSKCYKTMAVGRVLNSRTRARRQAARAAVMIKEQQDRLRRQQDFEDAMAAIEKLKEWMTAGQYEQLYDALARPWEFRGPLQTLRD
jgi:hypothetical protein